MVVPLQLLLKDRDVVFPRLGGASYGLVCLAHLLRIASHAVRDSSELTIQMNVVFIDSCLVMFNCSTFVHRVLHLPIACLHSCDDLVS